MNGSNVFVRPDIRQLLLSIATVNRAAAQFNGADPAYQAGFNACLLAVCTAFDMAPGGLVAYAEPRRLADARD